MARSEGRIGYGTLIQIEDALSPSNYITVGEAFSISTLGATKALVDFTHHESPGAFKEFKKGLAEGDEVTVACNRVVGEVGQEAIRDAFDAPDNVNFRVISPDAEETLDFPATVIHHDFDPALEDRMTFNFRVKIAGLIVYTPSSP
jgi:predicted secreted protein